MRAVRYMGAHIVQPVDLDAVPPAEGEVQIEVAYVGICGTDLHVLRGHMDERVAVPAVIGHEMSGTISAIGPRVSDWSVGDRVTVMPLQWDGTCPACVAGDTHICQNLDFVGIDSPGALQQLWNVRADLLVAVPPSLRLIHAALAEPVAVAVHDVRRGGLRAGERAVVIGGGPIGVLIASVIREWGGEVLVIEVDEARSAIVEALGFDCVDPAGGQAESRVQAWTGGAGADVVFEVSGSASGALSATGFARVRGRVVMVAIHPTPRPVDLQRVFWRELTVVGARVYERRDFDSAVDLLHRGVIPTESFITRVVSLDQTQDAFDALASGGEMKVLVDVRA